MDPTIVKKRLIARAAEVSNSTYDRQYQTSILNLMHDPQWPSRSRVQDWRNYIDEEVQEIWPSLPESSRIALYINAQKQAEKEEWE